ncbi:MAG: phage tail protein [Burkholderiales bacterium]|nr:phage tail protein [Burkholderiales bacterium]
MATPFLGEIRPFGFNFPPKGWASCDGQLLAINQNQALFAILGTFYGGDGRTTFALPDLRGRMPMHAGNGAGGSMVVGERGGAEQVTLGVSQMPGHGHAVMASANIENSTSPAGNVLGAKSRFGANVYAAAANLTPLAPGAVSQTGQSQAHDNNQPSLVLNFCIALQGIFPSRN